MHNGGSAKFRMGFMIAVRYFGTAALLATLIGIASAADRPGAVFLTIPPSARTLGVATACVASSRDISSVLYNPGSLGFHDEFCLSVTNAGLPIGIGRGLEQGILAASGLVAYEEVIRPDPPWLPEMLPDMRYVSGSCAMPLGRIGRVSLGYIRLGDGEFDVFDDQGRYVGSYEPYDVSPSVSFGRVFHNRLGVGITAKYIYSYLAPDWVIRPEHPWVPRRTSASSYAMDFGALFKIWGCGAGFSLQNLGPEIDYGTGSPCRLPTRIRGGVSFEPLVLLDSTRDSHFSQIFNVALTYDRAYDPEDPDDTWRCTAYEFTLLGLFSYRKGSWNWWDEGSTGFGVNLRNIEIDVAKYFWWDSYHVQLTFHPLEPPASIAEDPELNRKLLIVSACLAPGGAQFYKGEGLKGSLFLLPAMFLTDTYFSANYNDGKALPALGVAAPYVAAGLEALLSE